MLCSNELIGYDKNVDLSSDFGETWPTFWSDIDTKRVEAFTEFKVFFL